MTKIDLPLEHDRCFREAAIGLQDESAAGELLQVASKQYLAEFNFWEQHMLTDHGKELAFDRLDIWAKIGTACRCIQDSEKKIKVLLLVLSDTEDELE